MRRQAATGGRGGSWTTWAVASGAEAKLRRPSFGNYARAPETKERQKGQGSEGDSEGGRRLCFEAATEGAWAAVAQLRGPRLQLREARLQEAAPEGASAMKQGLVENIACWQTSKEGW